MLSYLLLSWFQLLSLPSFIITTSSTHLFNVRISDDRFEIYNSGSHIPEERLNEIWLPFKKADLSRSHSQGTGLGLAIARTILELHQFSYGVQNRDEGVVFWFTFR